MILIGSVFLGVLVFIWFGLWLHSLHVSRVEQDGRIAEQQDSIIDLRLALDRHDLLLKRSRKQLDTIMPDWRDDALLTDIWNHDDQRPISEASERIPSKGTHRRS